jgi:hypothetical protein
MLADIVVAIPAVDLAVDEAAIRGYLGVCCPAFAPPLYWLPCLLLNTRLVPTTPRRCVVALVCLGMPVCQSGHVFQKAETYNTS